MKSVKRSVQLYKVGYCIHQCPMFNRSIPVVGKADRDGNFTARPVHWLTDVDRF